MIRKARSFNKSIISQTYHPFLSFFEIDTIRMSMEVSKLTDSQLEFLFNLFNVADISSYGWNGKYKGFTLYVNDFNITITGSPSNYYVGKGNVLPYTEFKNVIEELSKELGVNLHKARLYRVDINWNYITKKPIESYTHNLFLDLSRFKRLERDLGVLFSTKSKAINIYNKSLLLEDKRIVNDKDNWLRIEFRILRNVKKVLGVRYVEDMYHSCNYKKLLLMFTDYYHKIKKKTVPTTDISALKSPKEYKKLLELAGITQKGGLSGIYRDIEHMSKMKVFDNPNQKYRLRKELQNLAENSLLSSPHPLVVELNSQFDKDLHNELEVLGNLY